MVNYLRSEASEMCSPSPHPPCPPRGPRDLLPVWRSDRGDGHWQPPGHQPARPGPALAHIILLRPSPPGRLPGCLARQEGEYQGSSGGLPNQGQTQWRGRCCQTFVKPCWTLGLTGLTGLNKDYRVFSSKLVSSVTICRTVGQIWGNLFLWRRMMILSGSSSWGEGGAQLNFKH